MLVNPRGHSLPVLVVLGHLLTLIVFWSLRKHKREGKRAVGYCASVKFKLNNDRIIKDQVSVVGCLRCFTLSQGLGEGATCHFH